MVAVATLVFASAAFAGITRTDYWGSDGTGDGQLHSPAYDAVDHTGNVYVADQQNSRVVKYSPSGEFLLTWGWGVKNGQPRLQTCTTGCQEGLPGSGKGQFGVSFGIAIHDGRVYVTDPPNDRVEVFNPTGRLRSIWGESGSGNGEFSNPQGIATDPAGHVYVADTLNNRVQKFSAGGKFLAKWGSAGTGDQDFQFPRGVAVGRGNHLYVSDNFNNRVKKYTLGGKFLRTWGSGVKTGIPRFEICTHRCLAGEVSSEDGAFADPDGVATDSAGDVYVVDAANFRIEKFAQGGRYITRFQTGRFFGVPQGIAIDRFDRYRVTYSQGYVVTFAQT